MLLDTNDSQPEVLVQLPESTWKIKKMRYYSHQFMFRQKTQIYNIVTVPVTYLHQPESVRKTDNKELKVNKL